MYIAVALLAVVLASIDWPRERRISAMYVLDLGIVGSGRETGSAKGFVLGAGSAKGFATLALGGFQPGEVLLAVADGFFGSAKGSSPVLKFKPRLPSCGRDPVLPARDALLRSAWICRSLSSIPRSCEKSGEPMGKLFGKTQYQPEPEFTFSSIDFNP